ncbi:SusC/RagA family TonB-linked outer membrane protein [Flavimarina sp. Hel_I_48]|uniref:SusC/RagA family TonB-linked outer membrane protein n=1 Tax=Flavimarina sp. Hel_I_48 TaxID=1392488 RepID=UPI0004DF556A|nr:SusC/RagA family TonB-linked outer membrane protein [Flavimarina sp. Hel_I_48]
MKTKLRSNLKSILLLNLILFFTHQTFAQEATISGSVNTTEGEPIPFANILIKGTTQGTTADMDGNYNITARTGDFIVFSSIGYKSLEIAIENQTTINAELQEDVSALDEVVVVGYGTLDKKEVTSSITHVDGDELLTVSSNNPIMALQGKVPGLTIDNSSAADPNSNPSIQLRGVSSRNAGLGPLIVINGFPGGSLQGINQNDIKSIDILKGGAASAIYGTRGSNGVIIITTKTGTGKPSAQYSHYVSLDFLSDNTLRPLTASQYLENERGIDFGGNTDWIDAITRSNALVQKHTLSVSGGGPSTTYRATVDYKKAEGIDIRSSREEYGARVIVNHKSENGRYEVDLNIAPRYAKRNDANYDVFGKALTLNPTIPVRDAQSPSGYTNIQQGYDGPYNILETLSLEEDGSEEKILDWNGSFTWNFSPTLNTKISIGESTTDYFDFFFRPSTSSIAINFDEGENSANRAYNKYDTKSLEWIGNYSLDIKKNTFKLLGGYSYQYFQSSGLSASNRNFPSDAFTYNNLGSGLYNQEEEGRLGLGSFKDSSTLIAFFSRLNYDFDNKYLMSASIRYEGSSKFGYENKWGVFPAVSVGWRVNDEEFMENVTWIDELKLRADYGETGNQDFGNYLSLDTYQGFGYYPLAGEYYQVWGPNQNTNYNLKWEKAINTNIGVDFGFLQRFSGSFNYYKRKNEDLLGYYPVQLPPNIVDQTYANVGTMENSGFELQLNASVIKSDDFSYDIAFAGSTIENKFVSFSNAQYEGQDFIDVVGLPAPGSPGNAQRLEEGKRIGSFYMYKSAGVSDQGELLIYNQAGDVITGAQAVYDDRQFVGNGLPRYNLSLSNTFKYKNWDASVFFRGKFDYELFNTLGFYIGTPVTPNEANVLQSAYEGPYSQLTSFTTISSVSDYFLESGDFVKLENITLGYTVDLKEGFANSLRIYASANNVATFTNFSGGDPDSYPFNGLYPGINSSRQYYPSTTQIVFGFDFNF